MIGIRQWLRKKVDRGNRGGMQSETTMVGDRATEEEEAEKLPKSVGHSFHSSKGVNRDHSENILAKAMIHCPKLGWAPRTGRISQFFVLFSNPIHLFKGVTQGLLQKGSKSLHSYVLGGQRLGKSGSGDGSSQEQG